jgi:hypothetical protein
MAWYDEDSWFTAAFAPKPSTIALTLLLTVLLPILLHQFIYRKATPTSLPTFLLLGPSGAGKTAFLTLVRAPLCMSGFLCLAAWPSPVPTLCGTCHLPRRVHKSSRIEHSLTYITCRQSARLSLQPTLRPSLLTWRHFYQKASLRLPRTIALPAIRLGSVRAASSLLTPLGTESFATSQRRDWPIRVISTA